MKVEAVTQALLAQTQRVLLRSGDGLGLTQLALSVAVPGRPFAVYPALQPVRTGPFLRYVWTSQRGAGPGGTALLPGGLPAQARRAGRGGQGKTRRPLPL